MNNGVAAADGTLQIGDILLRIDGESVANGKHKKDLIINLKLAGPGEGAIQNRIKLEASGLFA